MSKSDYYRSNRDIGLVAASIVMMILGCLQWAEVIDWPWWVLTAPFWSTWVLWIAVVAVTIVVRAWREARSAQKAA